MVLVKKIPISKLRFLERIDINIRNKTKPQRRRIDFAPNGRLRKMVPAANADHTHGANIV